jgi:hypothetical protein
MDLFLILQLYNFKCKYKVSDYGTRHHTKLQPCNIKVAG